MKVTQRYNVRKQLLLYWWCFGVYGVVHHKIVSGVWYSTNQIWYRCHGKVGIIALVSGTLIIGGYMVGQWVSNRYRSPNKSVVI